jgi:DNA polymerase-3 subunit alpha (Gram-positive type)
MGRACYPELDHHKLNTLCDYLGIALDHHDAGSDSMAAAKLLLDYMNHGMNVDDFIYNYDFQRSFAKNKGRTPVLSETTTQLLNLKAVLKNITADGQLSDQEVLSLRMWMEENQNLRGNFPFDKIFAVVENALDDGVLAADELQDMLQLFSQVTDPVAASASCECFDINGKTFCLTGEFVKGSRSLVEQILVQQGGTPAKSVTKKTDYVIVGSQGSDAWSAGNYGTKVKKALELQEKGASIKIVKEADISL